MFHLTPKHLAYSYYHCVINFFFSVSSVLTNIITGGISGAAWEVLEGEGRMSLKHQADNFYLLILNSSADLNDLKFFLTAGSPFAVTSKRKKDANVI